jgi:hypothetical protein
LAMTAATATAAVVLRALDSRPGPKGNRGYHPLHDPARAWPETNCYVDLWIEVLHALDLDPLPAMGFTLSTDFEGDQWTFFKPPLGDLLELYGVDVQELTIWRPMVEHLREQLKRKRLVLVEVDAFHLPDTQATDYRKNHSKTTIAVETLDEENKRLGYFHNSIYGELEGEDYAALFEGALPPYTEFVKVDRVVRRGREEMVAIAKRLLKRELAKRPKENPVGAFRTRFPVDAEWLFERDLASFHAYAFATLRQLGACFELASEHLRYLDPTEGGPHVVAAKEFETISTGVKALMFKVARMVNSKKKQNFDETLASMEQAWTTGMSTIGPLY